MFSTSTLFLSFLVLPFNIFENFLSHRNTAFVNNEANRHTQKIQLVLSLQLCPEQHACDCSGKGGSCSGCNNERRVRGRRLVQVHGLLLGHDAVRLSSSRSRSRNDGGGGDDRQEALERRCELGARHRHVLARGKAVDRLLGHVADLDDAALDLLLANNKAQGDVVLLALLELRHDRVAGLVVELGLEARSPQLLAQLHGVCGLAAARQHHVKVRLVCADLDVTRGVLGLQNGKDALNADADADAGDLAAVRVKHADEVVVAAAARDRADVRAFEDGLDNDAGVVVQAARKAQIEANRLGDTQDVQVAEQQLHLLDAILGQRVGGELGVGLELLDQVVPAHVVQLDVLADAVGHLGLEALLSRHLLLDLLPGQLVQLVHGRGNEAEVACGHSADGKDAVQQRTVVDLDDKVADVQRREDLVDDGEALCVRHHGGVAAGNVKVALVELAVAAFGHLRVVAAVHAGNVVSLEVLDLVLGAVAGKGHRQVIAQSQQLATLVGNVVNQLGVLAVLAREGLLQLHDGRVDGDGAVALEDAGDDGKDVLADGHLLRAIVLHALRRLQLEGLVLALLLLGPLLALGSRRRAGERRVLLLEGEEDLDGLVDLLLGLLAGLEHADLLALRVHLGEQCHGLVRLGGVA
eukprot:m.196731 g.196731  ORF g.196731 m.196731 type:complete len:638 (+) comp17654_c2_seq3:2394-4307(+)